MKRLLSYFLVAMLSSFFSYGLFTAFESPSASLITTDNSLVRTASFSFSRLTNTINRAPDRETQTERPSDFIYASRSMRSSVVSINMLDRGGYRISSGSGVIFSTDGYIITNYHVVDEGSDIQVTLPDKRMVPAKMEAFDENTDLALIKVEQNGLDPAVFGDSDDLAVGEWVVAIGNPFNLNSTVTAGIVSAKGRNINILEGNYAVESFIQTDAVVNTGNSGGALVNIEGELVGINAALISETGSYEGYSFAIPSNLVYKIVTDLRDHGVVQRAILGINVQELTSTDVRDLQLPAIEGVLVSNVYANGSASRAGIRTDDVILRINNARINTVPELKEQLALYRPDDRVTVGIIRKGKRMDLNNVRLQAIGEASYSPQ